MEFDLKKTAKEKTIIVAHRGVAGGNIPCNTLCAYENALKQGADMIEIDVSLSKDGVPFVFHPGMEYAHLNLHGSLSELTADEIASLRFVNADRTPTQYPVYRLDEVFERFKGRCYINVDKFWEHPDVITEHIRAFDILPQILVKTGASDKCFDVIERVAPDIPYMVLVRSDGTEIHNRLKKRRINYIGQEILFDSDESPLCSREYLDFLKSEDILAWANSIVYNYKTVISAGHTDDAALGGDMDAGWGWLVRRGFDIIQTDWPLMMKMYLEDNGLLRRA